MHYVHKHCIKCGKIIRWSEKVYINTQKRVRLSNRLLHINFLVKLLASRRMKARNSGIEQKLSPEINRNSHRNNSENSVPKHLKIAQMCL